MKQRPTGVTILAIILILLSLWSICWGIVGFGAVSVGAIAGVFGFDTLTAEGFMGSFFGVLWGVGAFIVGIGLWQLAPWARSLAVVIAVLKLVGFVVALIGPGAADWIGAIISVVILFYVTRPNIKAAFS